MTLWRQVLLYLGSHRANGSLLAGMSTVKSLLTSGLTAVTYVT